MALVFVMYKQNIVGADLKEVNLLKFLLLFMERQLFTVLFIHNQFNLNMSMKRAREEYFAKLASNIPEPENIGPDNWVLVTAMCRI
jgi:hypothetical protein